jgi:hypothetical protein
LSHSVPPGTLKRRSVAEDDTGLVTRGKAYAANSDHKPRFSIQYAITSILGRLAWAIDPRFCAVYCINCSETMSCRRRTGASFNGFLSGRRISRGRRTAKPFTTCKRKSLTNSPPYLQLYVGVIKSFAWKCHGPLLKYWTKGIVG